MSTLELLQQYASACQRLLVSLESDRIDSPDSAVLCQMAVVDFLPPSGPSCHAFSLKLQKRNLAEHLDDSIRELYRSRMNDWRREVLRVSSVLQSHLSRHCSGGNFASKDLFYNAYRASYAHGLQAMQSDILRIVDQRLQEFHAHSEAAASASSSENLSETDNEQVRGHGAEAVAILEAAYAYTTNITQAEKRRLAQATGLEPRQVVIWFQNRRNRKVKGRENPVTTSQTISDTKHVIAQPRKRKMSCNEGEDHRRPTKLAYLEKDVRSIEHPPAPLNRRMFSRSSSTSLVSSVDSSSNSSFFSWNTISKSDKQRRLAGGTSITHTSPSLTGSDISGPGSVNFHPSGELQELRCSQLLQTVHSSEAPHPSDSFLQTAAQGMFAEPIQHHLLPPQIAPIFSDESQEPRVADDSQPMASSYLFPEGSNVPRLDFDDLKLSVADLEKNVSLPCNFAIPPPSGMAQIWRRDIASSEAHAAVFNVARHDHHQGQISADMPGHSIDPPLEQVSSKPYHLSDIADALKGSDPDVLEALTALPTIQGNSSFASVLFANESQHEARQIEVDQEQLVLPLPTSTELEKFASTYRGREFFTPPSRVEDAMSPEDFRFTFDFAGLGLDQTFEEVRQSYRWAEEEAKMYSVSELEDESAAQSSSDWEITHDTEQGERRWKTRQSPVISSPAPPESPGAVWSRTFGSPDWNSQQCESEARGISIAY